MRREREHAQGFDRCRVNYWHGYVTGRFYVQDPRDGAIVSSPAFRTWRPPWQPRVRLDDSPEAVVAFDTLRRELARLGWLPARTSGALTERVFVRNEENGEPIDPGDIAEQLLLRALEEVAGENGATAAELGRALYGDSADSVHQLPQRLGSRLRQLQLQGKVARHHANGANHWLVASPRER
jgi:hypothetical protein